MKCLLDTNVFLEAFLGYYGMEVAPGFWVWLEEENKAGVLFSNASVLTELQGQLDEAAEWALNRQGIFLKLPKGLTKESNPISDEIKSVYSKEGYDEFSRGADLLLVAHALVGGFTVVTQENESTKHKEIKIPIVCRQFGVPCINLLELVRKEKMELVLKL